MKTRVTFALQYLTEAAPILEQVRDSQIKVLGPTHPETLKTADALSQALNGIEKIANSTATLEQQYKTLSEELGEDHKDSLAVLAQLGKRYWEANQLDKSIPIFERLVEQRETSHGRKHELTTTAIANLGVNYLGAKRATDAVPYLKEAYQSRHKWVENPLLIALSQAGEKEELVVLVTKIVARERKRLGEDSVAISNMLAEFGFRLITAKAWHEAEEILRECLSTRQQLLPNDWKTFNTSSMLGESILGQGRLAEAERLLVEGYEGLREREQEIKNDASLFRLTQSIERLVLSCSGRKWNFR